LYSTIVFHCVELQILFCSGQKNIFHSAGGILFSCLYIILTNVKSYTQGRIAGDSLSSRKTARAERCTPKTTAAALAG